MNTRYVYTLAKYQPKISLGSQIPGPGWYEIFEKSQYQYQPVCSKVDTHPTLVENLNPFWSRLSTDGRDWRHKYT
jgi:hypothetical protein